MTENTALMHARYPELVTVTEVGMSAQGIPINMISIGKGPLSALFVDAPHPNEVIGCTVIEYLITRLCQDTAFREALPFLWHFIKAIEPDTLQLNEGWFRSPGNLQRYYEQYYRPPLNQQAEYAFPFADNDWLSRHPLPENIAWQNAIRLARPDFLYSLHNSEAGGVYYVASGSPAGPGH
ncbi:MULTISPECIES: M14 family zinc carboxypeptidase [Enterobacteriaceae]|uniref:M14 family zinc carboxypeptidase n=1 Tax=Enterobacteriaceae TaxID=543 RepID=UPI0028A1C3C2|nr:M14 family zinc carboxypeptidase [Cedecea neteri]